MRLTRTGRAESGLLGAQVRTCCWTCVLSRFGRTRETAEIALEQRRVRFAVESLLHDVASTSWQRLPWASLPGIEEGDDGEHAAVVIACLWKAKLAEDAVDVFFHGSLRHPQLAGDPGVRAALGERGGEIVVQP